MQIRRVTALLDTEGRDISGNRVDMYKNTIHLVSEVDIEYYLSRPLAFVVSNDIEIATYALDVSGNVIGFVLPNGTTKLYSSFGISPTINGTAPDISGNFTLTEDNIPTGTVNVKYTATEKTKLTALVNYDPATLIAQQAAQQVSIDGLNAQLVITNSNDVALQAQIDTKRANVMNSGRLLGRTTASPGVLEEITVGDGLIFASGLLSAIPVTGGGTGAAAAPVLVLATQIFTVPNNSQVLFSDEIDFEDGAMIDFSDNSVLIEI